MRAQLAIAMVLLCAPAAHADVPFPRTPTVPAKFTLPARVLPVAPAAPAQQAPARPAITADAVLTIPDLEGPQRREQEQILIDLIANTPDREAEEKSDYYFRLGTLYAKRVRQDPSDKAALIKAVKTFRAVTENQAFRNYPKIDVALFYLGYTLQAGKYMKEARATYDQLLKNYPNSRYVPEAHLVFAEYYFDANQFADAEARYKQVLKFPKSPSYWFAHYKVGWIHLALQRYQDALEVFFTVAQGTNNDRKIAALNTAAKHDFVRAYAEIGKVDKALAAFSRVDAKLAAEMVGLLADLYVARGKPDQALAMYRELVKAHPDNPGACAWQVAIARSTTTMLDRVGELERLATIAGQHATNVPCIEDATAMVGLHARAMHTAGYPGFAARLYGAYVAAFPQAADRDAIAIFLGDALWAEGNMEAAANAFAIAAPRDKDAAISATLAWQNALAIEVRPEVMAGSITLRDAAAAAPPKPQVLGPREAKLVAAFDLAAPHVTAAERVRMTLVKAVVLRRAHQFEAIDAALTDLVARERKHASIELAANLLLEARLRLGRYDAVLELADALRAEPQFLTGKPALESNIQYLRTHSLRRR